MTLSSIKNSILEYIDAKSNINTLYTENSGFMSYFSTQECLNIIFISFINK